MLTLLSFSVCVIFCVMPAESNFDFPRFERDLLDAARAALVEVSARVPDDPIRAFALYTDAGAMSVCPAMASASHFAGMAAEEPDDADYYRFTPAEWSHEGEGAAAAFDGLSRRLRMHLKHLPSTGFAPFKARLLDACEQCVQTLRTESRAQAGEGFLWLVAVSDENEPATLLVPRMQRLNAPSIAQAFAAWAATWDDE